MSVFILFLEKKHAPNYQNDQAINGTQVLKCENCGNALDEQGGGKIRKDKRFCSTSCAKRFASNTISTYSSCLLF